MDNVHTLLLYLSFRLITQKFSDSCHRLVSSNYRLLNTAIKHPPKQRFFRGDFSKRIFNISTGWIRFWTIPGEDDTLSSFLLMMSAPCNAPLLISPDTASPFHNDLRRPRLDLGVPGHRQCNILSFSNTLFHTVSSCTASRCIQFSSQVYALWCPKYCLPRRTSPYSQCYVLLPGARVKTSTF